jgi:hypothetical protein
LVPGEAQNWIQFDVAKGLEELRVLLSRIQPGQGGLLLGEVGLTRHVPDVMRKANVPARMEPQEGTAP